MTFKKKKELTGGQSHTVHKEKQLLPCSQSMGEKCISQTCSIFCVTLNNFNSSCLELCLKPALPSLKAKHKF